MAYPIDNIDEFGYNKYADMRKTYLNSQRQSVEAESYDGDIATRKETHLYSTQLKTPPDGNFLYESNNIEIRHT